MLRLIISLLIAGQGISVSGFAATSQVGVRVIAPYSGGPRPITSIQAAPDYSGHDTGGKIRLQWSAPQTPDGGAVFSYLVRYATYSACDLQNDATSWWNSTGVTTLSNGTLPAAWGISATAPPGNSEAFVVTGLVPGTYYYFGVKAIDRYHRFADFDDPLNGIVTQVKAYASPLPRIAMKINDLTASSTNETKTVMLRWTVPQFYDPNDTNYTPVNGVIRYPGEYCVQYSTVSPPTGSPSIALPNQTNNWAYSTRLFISTSGISTGDRQSLKITGLTLDTTYYFHIFTRNEKPDNWSSESTPKASARPVILNPVGSLTAAAGGAVDAQIGSFVKLDWINPAANALSGVRICYDTVQRPTSPEWPQHIELADQISGAATDYTHIRLLPRTTYYYAVYAYDYTHAYSPVAEAMSYTAEDYLAPEKPRDITGIVTAYPQEAIDRHRITLRWTTPPAIPAYRNSDLSETRIYFSTYTYAIENMTYLSSISVTNGQTTSYVHHALKMYTTYYYSLASVDVQGNISDERETMCVYLSENYEIPNPPIVITSLVNADPDPNIGCTLYLKWTSPSTPGLGSASIVCRTDRYPQGIDDGTVLWSGAAMPNVTYENNFTRLSPQTTYYIALYARTQYGIDSLPSFHSIFIQVPWSDAIAPFMPLGTTLSKIGGNQVRLQWKQVKYNEDHQKFVNTGSPHINDLYSYEVYRSTALYSSHWTLCSRNVGQISEYIETLPDDRFYFYKVRALDATGNFEESFIVDTEGGLIALNNDGSYLWISQNSLDDQHIIRFERHPEEEVGPIIKSIEWNAFRVVESTASFNLVKEQSFVIRKSADTHPLIGAFVDAGELAVSYRNTRAAGSSAAPGSNSALSDIFRNLALYYYNGIEWLKIGSAVEEGTQTANAKSKFAGKYQLRAATPATDFSFFGIMPKIITPNGDGQNDVVFFRFANPKSSPVTVRLMDVNGGLVTTINTAASSDTHGAYITWNGTDKDGETVLPGVYIYQLEGEGKTINGTIIVAR